MVPTGGTPMRYGIYKAINEIRENSKRTRAVRAIILLSDGDYNWYGDPLARYPARGQTYSVTNYDNLDYDWQILPNITIEEQNMSIYAKNNNIKIFSIGYAADITAGGKNALRILAESTGGTYYDGDAANIDDIYLDIAGQLQDEASVDTLMDLDYGRIEVNYNITTVNETYRIFDYVPETKIDSYFTDLSRPNHTPEYPYTLNQTDEFNATRQLNFNIGTIKLGQTWEAIYTLRVLTDGNINVFGEDSNISFNGTAGVPQVLKIPKTYITGVPEMVTTGINASILNITVGDPTSDSGSSIVTFPISREYTGNMTVKEDYYISTDGGMTWMLIGFNLLTPEEANIDSSYSLDRNYFPPGVEIEFRVVGNALDAPGPIISTSRPSPPQQPPDKSYIILK